MLTQNRMQVASSLVVSLKPFFPHKDPKSGAASVVWRVLVGNP